MLILETRRPGRAGFCRGAPLSHIRSFGLSKKKFPEILEISGSCLTRMRQRCSGVFVPTKSESSRISCAQPRYPVIHEYGLQMAEGTVTFFESYERKLEKYWTKPLLFQLSLGIPPLPDSSDAHNGRRHQSAR